MPRLIQMRKGHSPEESQIEVKDNKAILKALERVWSGEIDGIMVMKQ